MPVETCHPDSKANTDNATYLFAGRHRDFRNAEQWWSALFSMLILMNGRQGVKLPMRSHTSSGHSPAVDVTISAEHYNDVIADGALSKSVATDVFGLSKNLPEDFKRLRPDVTVFAEGSGGKNVVFFETKTIGTLVNDDIKQIARYKRLRDFLCYEGWKADVYYLLSHGHEEGAIWDSLQEADIQYILWEDVLKLIADSPLNQVFANLGRGIAEYATPSDATN